ncbi:WxL domain-containing protein [Neobacillus sp. LXY-4]|uniref:WxL domain-containing protein n=1 Tax=Neobacillus sp. LXY-4 TaxID=3379826 RepID=UPI003EE15614
MRLSKYVFLGLACILSLFLSVQGVFAASTGTSNAIVNFIEDTSVPPVLDPDDPTDPYVPGDDDNDPTGNYGPLSLDYVSHIDFGQQVVSVKNVTYEAKTLKPFLQVTDKRGTPDGWNVTVSATPFKSAGGNELAGAYLSFKNGTTISDLKDMYGPPVTGPFTLFTNNDAVKVVYANPNEGRGTWITKWFPSNPTASTNDSVTLTVYGGTMKAESYTSTLTWTLTTAP